MKHSILKAMFLLLVIVSMISCKKIDSNTQPVLQKNVYSEKERKWYESIKTPSKVGKGILSRSISSRIDSRYGDPIWEATVYFPYFKM